MARLIANVDIQVDTFGSWISRTNQLLESFSSEVLTANSTNGVTGTLTNKRNATLYGSFSTNTFSTSDSFKVGSAVSANSISFTFGPSTKVIAGGAVGQTGQILTMGTTGLVWSYAGTGTVTKVTAGNGLTGNVTSSGTISVRPSTGISVSSAGVSIDPAYIATLDSANSATLQSKTWASPARIGSGTPNTGIFTTLTAGSYGITNDTFFTFNGNQLTTRGYIDTTTPASGSLGGVNVRAVNGTNGTAKIRFTDYSGATAYGTATIDKNGLWSWSGAIAAVGALSAPTASFTGNVVVSSGNARGGGLTLSDAGDIADLNDGYASLRFTNGVKIYSAAKGGTPTLTLKNDGTISANGDDFVKLSDFTEGVGVGPSTTAGSTGNWVKLPNGLILQWGTIPAQQDSTATVYFAQAFSTPSVSVVVSGGVRNGDNGAGENPTTVVAVGSTYFQTWTTENINETAWWIAMGF